MFSWSALTIGINRSAGRLGLATPDGTSTAQTHLVTRGYCCFCSWHVWKNLDHGDKCKVDSTSKSLLDSRRVQVLLSSQAAAFEHTCNHRWQFQLVTATISFIHFSFFDAVLKCYSLSQKLFNKYRKAVNVKCNVQERHQKEFCMGLKSKLVENKSGIVFLIVGLHK